MRPEWNLHFFITIEALEILGGNGEGAVFFWFHNGQVSCNCISWFSYCVINKGLFHKLVLTLGVHIEDLRLILAISVFVVICFGCYGVRTIRLTRRSVPDNVFHAISMRPEWNLHFFIAIKTLKVLGGNRESPIFFWFCNSQISWNRSLIALSNVYRRRCSTHTRHLSIILNIVKVDIVKTGWVFMVRRFHIDSIGSICLPIGCIPNKIILATCFWPDRYRNCSNSIRCFDIWDHDIKATGHGIVIDNVNFPT